MSAADGLASAMRAATWRTLIGLLAVTGMRQGEACRLERGEVGLEAGTLVIAGSKFGKSRQVFLHPTAAAALRGYERGRAGPAPAAVHLARTRRPEVPPTATSATFVEDAYRRAVSGALGRLAEDDDGR